MYVEPSEHDYISKGVDYINKHDTDERGYETDERDFFDRLDCFANVDEKADNNVDQETNEQDCDNIPNHRP